MDCEIEFLPVGRASKGDAIVVRHGTPSSFGVMIVDGGDTESGKAMVEHIQTNYGKNCIVGHIVLTHADADHVSGLREVLAELDVRNLWLHLPWKAASAALPYFSSKNWTESGLAAALHEEYDLLAEIVRIAEERNIPIHQPFAGQQIGPFRVLSPGSDVYPLLLPQFDRTPEADQAAIKEAGYWIGKGPTFMDRMVEKVASKIQK
jgi:glyoxylase-like metal-dependent hydrolase (beta-lactamase superfamily II)